MEYICDMPFKLRIRHSQKRKILQELGIVDPIIIRRIKRIELVSK